MKKVFSCFSNLIIFLLVLLLLFNKPIIQYVLVHIVYEKTLNIEDANVYKKGKNYEYVKFTDNFIPKNKQDIINIIYTVLDNGWDTFSFYCPREYTTCMDDLNDITKNNEVLSNINNFTHPFNGFDNLFISTNSFDKIQISVKKTYTDEMIVKVNDIIDSVLDDIIKDDMTSMEKIEAIHDYIIELASYDHEHAKIIENKLNIEPTYKSDTAYGTLVSKKAICGGYTDTMAIFLNKLGFDNYKISSNNHVWNAVKIDDTWYHLDLTWDDPVLETGEDVLTHTFFLISKDELLEKDTTQHIFDEDVYKEAS